MNYTGLIVYLEYLYIQRLVTVGTSVLGIDINSNQGHHCCKTGVYRIFKCIDFVPSHYVRAID